MNDPITKRLNPEYGKAFPCICRKQTREEQRKIALIKYCAIPEYAKEFTFENFETNPTNQNAFESAIDFLAGRIRFLTIIGNSNTGKTHLACSVCQEYLAAGIPAKYAFTPDLLNELRETYNRDAEYSYANKYARLSEVPLLVLDDIYANKTSEWTEETLTSLINARYMNKTATIITSNKSLSEMGGRISSRLQREDWCRVVILEK